MTKLSAYPDNLHQPGKDASLLYRMIFSVLFCFSLMVFFVTKLVGKTVEGGVIKTAKQAAHASAGYAVMH